jgi:thiol:disulfide interchange protein
MQPDNTIQLENNCFINNNFFGNGIVLLNNAISKGISNNYVSVSSSSSNNNTSTDCTTDTTDTTATSRSNNTNTTTNLLSCSFVYDAYNSTCIVPDATTCQLIGANTTTNTNTTNTTLIPSPPAENQNTTTTSPAINTTTTTTSKTTSSATMVHSHFIQTLFMIGFLIIGLGLVPI